MEDYPRSEEWPGEDDIEHNRIVMAIAKFYPVVEKEETPAEPEKKPGKSKK